MRNLKELLWIATSCFDRCRGPQWCSGLQVWHLITGSHLFIGSKLKKVTKSDQIQPNHSLFRLTLSLCISIHQLPEQLNLNWKLTGVYYTTSILE